MENNSNLFNIRNLTCTYAGSQSKAIYVDKLDIACGRFVVIVGKSGSGKSTLLEVLGLMNNTLQTGSSISIHLEGGRKEYLYENLWRDPREKDIQYIRKEHFSFIFQSTNLMPNFTALENVIMSLMIQGKSQEESSFAATRLMQLVGLGDVDSKKKTYELSGGQKQRLAFVRAMIPEFTVIFGDEPTGNLDETNSRELFGLLRTNIAEQKRTAIIVSHNIDLAVEFSDQILVLTKEKGYGEFLDSHIFQHETNGSGPKWINLAGDKVSDIKATLRSLL
ncbi:MAG: ABC transporter ATP-binding protein [Bacteroidetes bacterium]|nr:ABC transporter ATP-binding protein [Bacteroidota bacterium]